MYTEGEIWEHIKEDERLIDQARRHLSAISPDARFPFDGSNSNNEASSLHTHTQAAYDEYFLLLLSGRSPSMAMMMMTIICWGLWSGGSCPFHSSVPFFVFADCRHLIPIRAARARATTAVECVIHPADKKPAEEPHVWDPSSIADLLRSTAFLFFADRR